MVERPPPTQLDVRDHLLVLLRRKWVVIGSIIAFGALAFAWSSLQTPVYSSSARVLIQRPGSSANQFNPGGQVANADLLAEIELQFYNGEAVKRAAEEKLGYPASATGSAGGRGSVMQITSSNTNPQKASDVANRYAEAYVEIRRKFSVDDFASTAQITQAKIDDIDRQLAVLDEQATQEPPPTTGDTRNNNPPTTVTRTTSLSGQAQRNSLAAQREVLEKNLANLQISQQNAETGGPQILVPAKPATSPTSPNPERDTIMGLLVGLLLGVAAAFLIDFLDDSIKSRTDLEAATEAAPILAIIPYLEGWKRRSDAHLASIERPSSPTSEAYRTLRTSVQFAGLERTIHSLQITSPRSQDGKSTTSANLAVALARAGLRVILVDCDLRRPRVHEFFNASNAVGFTSVLLGQARLDQALQGIENIPTLQLLASGPTPPNPSELLSGRRAADLVQNLKDGTDILVFDTPPVLPVSDALVISDLMDAVILVVAAGSTTKKEAHRAYEMLRQVEAPIIGTIMNSGPGQSGYGYGYGYAYGYGESPTRSGLGRLFGGRSRGGSSTDEDLDRHPESSATR